MNIKTNCLGLTILIYFEIKSGDLFSYTEWYPFFPSYFKVFNVPWGVSQIDIPEIFDNINPEELEKLHPFYKSDRDFANRYN